MTYLKNQEVYLDRYGIVPAPAPQPSGDAEYNLDFVGDDLFTDQAPAAAGQQYRQLEQGSVGDADTDYLAELNQFADQESFQNQGIDLDTAHQRMSALQAQFDSAELPAALKKEWQDKISAANQRLGSGEMEDLSEIEDLQEEFKGALEENPTLSARLAESLGLAGVEVSPETIQQAMKNFGFTEASLHQAPLIGETKKMTDLMNFLKAIDPGMAQRLAVDPEKGFDNVTLTELRGLLDVVYPGGSNTNLAVQLVDATATGTWDNEILKNSITGEKVHYDGDYNNRFYDVNKFADIMNTLASGGSFDLPNYLNAGRNSVDNGARNKGLEVRKFLTGLYDVCAHNPYLMRHYLKQIPESSLLAMKDVLDYRGGGGNDSSTRNLGERWDTAQSSNVLNWAINGGVLPVELVSDETQSLGGVPISDPT